MKPLSEQDHFEILEVQPNASRDEIERAYRLAQATYAEDSLAGYSVFGEGDAEALRERIETAYRVLSDEESRRAYRASLSGGGPIDEGEMPDSAAGAGLARPVAPVDDFGEIDEESGEFDGAQLRRSRLRRGIDLDEVASITKINPTYLRFIEEERFSDLPAQVYVRGFVTAYASCVGLDPKRVAASYMRRFREASPGHS
jgi:curved DNA-binding protein CbpA